MNKIKSINITGIRGIKDTLPLTLAKKSILIYGDSGTGKSSLVDALEWFYNDEIVHLSNEEIGRRKGKDALRNIFLPDNDDATIEIQYSNKNFDTEKSIDNSLTVSATNTSKVFQDYIAQSKSENLILRYRDLVQFILASKTDKLNKLQEIIGFSRVGEIRSLLKKFAGRIAKQIKTTNYSHRMSSEQAKLIECLGQNITSPKQFFEATTKLIKPLKLGKNIKSLKDARAILKAIESKEDTKLIEQINFHNKISDTLTELEEEIDNIHSSHKKYFTTYNELKKDADKIKKLQLLALLTEGLKVLKKDILKDNYCPLCEQEKNKLDLIKQLNKRIEELQELKNEKENLEELQEELKEVLQSKINEFSNLLKDKFLEDDMNAKLSEKIKEIKSSINLISEELKKDIFSAEPLNEFAKLQIDKKGINILIEEAKKKAKELTDSQKHNTKLVIYTKLFRAIEAYISYRKIQKEQELMTKQQVTFEVLYCDFIKRQEEALNTFLKMFSSDINNYYVAMNPNEKVENIKLVPLAKADELVGITIEYSFYDGTKSPPAAYLSESHINCLGLSFFLTSIKAFNKQNQFFILDDVISSFDRSHRARFAKLLIDKFNDYQIILLTHEKDFFELVSSDVKTKGWLIHQFKWSVDHGTGIEKTTVDIKERISKKFAVKNTDGLGNDIRIYTEKVMKEVALNIEASVSFRYNDINEKRMAPELLDCIQRRISDKSVELKTVADITRIKGMPMFIGNIASHDNDFQASIEDFEVMWDDIGKLIKVFYCKNCNKFISTKYLDPVKKRIRCGCKDEKLSYDWK
ncbi:AAA family ATPase [Bacteroidota bacterium]